MWRSKRAPKITPIRRSHSYSREYDSFEANAGVLERQTSMRRCLRGHVLCVVLLEGVEGLEEFGQIDLGVAAGGQGFVRHLLQPPVLLLFCLHQLNAIWRKRGVGVGGGRREDGSIPPLKLNNITYNSSLDLDVGVHFKAANSSLHTLRPCD